MSTETTSPPAGHNDWDLAVKPRKVESLKLRQNNPRTHTPKQVRQIADSIKTFGFVNPVLIDQTGAVVAGHGRVAAAKLLGLESVPTITLEHLSGAQIRAYVIADNRLAELAGWDEDLLALELKGLSELELDFDLPVIGFETAEIDLLVGEPPPEETDPADEIPELPPDKPPVSRQGDLWTIGPHRLLCANALDGASYGELMAGEMAQLVFTDPPYNVAIEGNVSGLGRNKHQDFAMASGEMTEAEFTSFLEIVLGHHAAHSCDGAIQFVCMDWRHLFELLSAGRQVYSELKNLCVWSKTNAGMGSLYRSQHELITVFKSGTAPHVNNVELGRFGRNRTNVWEYPGFTSFGAERDESLAMHPTVKPVALVSDAILDCSHRNAIVLDGFAGSGTTLLAAQRTGRRGFGIEIDPRYVDVTIRRLALHAGLEATHAAAGQTFAEVEKQRAASGASGDVSANADSEQAR